MTTSKFLRAALAAAAVLTCGLASAADTQDITVTAQVNGACKLTTLNDMSFTLDPSGGAAGAATADIGYKCTRGTAPTSFSVGGSTGGSYSGSGAAALAGATAGNTDTIAYTITWTPPTDAGTGFGTGSSETTVTLNGAIPLANFQNVMADTYSKQLTIAINN